jgi:hypothetical protein
MPATRPDLYLEIRLHHWREFLRLSRELGSIPGVRAEDFDKILAREEDALAKADKQLKANRDLVAANTANRPVLQKAMMAVQYGLTQTAVDLLINAEPKDLENPRDRSVLLGGQLLVDLLVGTGQVRRARAVLGLESGSDESFDKRRFGRHPFGGFAYDWLVAQLAAAEGDYAAADRALGECLAETEKEGNAPIWPVLGQLGIATPAGRKGTDLGTFSALLTGHVLLEGSTKATSQAWVLGQTMFYKVPGSKGTASADWLAHLSHGNDFLWTVLRKRGDLWAVRAWLSLEAGYTDRARDQARKALEQGYGPAPRYYGQRLAAIVLELTESGRRASR